MGLAPFLSLYEMKWLWHNYWLSETIWFDITVGCVVKLKESGTAWIVLLVLIVPVERRSEEGEIRDFWCEFWGFVSKAETQRNLFENKHLIHLRPEQGVSIFYLRWLFWLQSVKRRIWTKWIVHQSSSMILQDLCTS